MGIVEKISKAIFNDNSDDIHRLEKHVQSNVEWVRELSHKLYETESYIEELQNSLRAALEFVPSSHAAVRSRCLNALRIEEKND